MSWMRSIVHTHMYSSQPSFSYVGYKAAHNARGNLGVFVTWQGAWNSCDESYRQHNSCPLNQPGGSGTDFMAVPCSNAVVIGAELYDQEEPCGESDMQEFCRELAEDSTADCNTSVKLGSIRVSITATAATPAARAKLLHRLCSKLSARCGPKGAFSITLCFMDHMVNIVKPNDSSAALYRSEMVQCPEIKSAYFHHVQDGCMVLEGYSLQRSCFWAYCMSLQTVEYLIVVSSSAGDMLAPCSAF